jgi:hypothetical protein
MATVQTQSTSETISPTTEEPAVTSRSQEPWTPAPGVFPAGCAFCLLHGDLGTPGTPFVVRLKASTGYCFAPHSHPHDEHATVLSGRIRVGHGPELDRDAATPLGPGDYVFLPREQFHSVWITENDTVIQVNAVGPFGITYANPADDPRNATAH